jgi:catechol 2,3-dioxygenase-like lactoylglutathione lyase family enzyme
MGVVTTTTGGTAVLEKVFYASVLVSDQDKALDFYTNVLGLEKRVENPTPDGPRPTVTVSIGVAAPILKLPVRTTGGTPGISQVDGPRLGRGRAATP